MQYEQIECFQVLWEKMFQEEDNLLKIEAKPFERGYGVTVGNALRRMLLSSIEGAAIIGVKLEGIYHEFSSIPGVLEDVTEIILNLKGQIQ